VVNHYSWTYVVVGLLVLLGIGLFFYNTNWPDHELAMALPVASSLEGVRGQGVDVPDNIASTPVIAAEPAKNGEDSAAHTEWPHTGGKPQRLNRGQDFIAELGSGVLDSGLLDPSVVVDNYYTAWRAQRKDQLAALWLTLSQCEPCITLLVEQMLSHNLEKGLIWELAIKMVALHTDAVLPVFNALIDPSENRSIAIILSEKLIVDGRKEYVASVFEAIQVAEQSGHDAFAQQLTWVIAKLTNPEGVGPVLDIIAGRVVASPAYASHVSRVFSKTVLNIPDKAFMSDTMSRYYLSADTIEKEKLWDVVRHHPGTLVQLAVHANADGQSSNVEKYANAVTQLPDIRAIDGVMKLQGSVEQSPGYFIHLIQTVVNKRGNAKALNRLDDYLRHLNVSTESRLLAAEGLLAVKHIPQSRQILNKALNQAHYPDPEVLSYISARL